MNKIVTIKFKGRITLDVYFGDDEDNFEPTDFFAGEEHEVFLQTGNNSRLVDIEFENGNVVFQVSTKLFEVVKE